MPTEEKYYFSHVSLNDIEKRKFVKKTLTSLEIPESIFERNIRWLSKYQYANHDFSNDYSHLFLFRENDTSSFNLVAFIEIDSIKDGDASFSVFTPLSLKEENLDLIAYEELISFFENYDQINRIHTLLAPKSRRIRVLLKKLGFVEKRLDDVHYSYTKELVKEKMLNGKK